MTPRILLCSDQPPSYGGAATALYSLSRLLQRRGFAAHHLSLVGREDLTRWEQAFGPDWRNPSGLCDTQTRVVDTLKTDDRHELRAIVRAVDPTLVIGRNDVAPSVVKSLLPEVETWFLASSCKRMKWACRSGAVATLADGVQRLHELTGSGASKDVRAVMPDDSDWRGYPDVTWEGRAVNLCDRIVCGSEVTKRCFEAFYPHTRRKMADRILWGAALVGEGLGGAAARPWDSRPIDVLFVASNWGRFEKNYPLLEQITLALGGLAVQVVGECPHPLQAVHHHGLVSHREVIELMGQAKTLVCPSLFDTSPNVLFEASQLGCNVVASKNCGNWQLCHDALLAEPYSAKAFCERIRLSLQRRYQDRFDFFLRGGPLEWFVASVAEHLAQARPAASGPRSAALE